MIGLFDVC